MPFETDDPIAKIPASCFRSEMSLFAHDQLLPPNLDFTRYTEQVWAKYQSGDTPGAMVDSIVKMYGLATHEENVAWGEQIQTIRGAIAETAQAQGIDLFAVSQGRQTLSDELMSQFQQLHETATALALKNFGLVAFILTRTSTPILGKRITEDVQDLLQEGWLAIYLAALRYSPWHRIKNTGDPQDALHFSTYAGEYIRGYIKNYQPFFLPIKVGRQNIEEFYLYQRIKRELEEQRGVEASQEEIVARVKLRTEMNIFEPTNEEVAEYLAGTQKRQTLGRIVGRFKKLIDAAQSGSLDEPRVRSFRDNLGEWVTEELDPIEPGISDETSPEIKAQDRLSIEEIERALNVLSPKERKVLVMRFGLKGGVALTLEEAGQKMGLTRERIRQIEGKALRKLRHPSRSKWLRDIFEQ